MGYIIMFTPKQRMLNAYRGIFSDRVPIAPEFWYYIPAKILGVSMMEFEREIPLWQGLKTAFSKYGTEGWGVAFSKVHNQDLEKKSKLIKISETQYRDITTLEFRGREFETTRIFDLNEPSWTEKHMATNSDELAASIELLLSNSNSFDFQNANKGYAEVGETYLLEMWLGVPFFDFIAGIIGFENAIIYFASEAEEKLVSIRERYIDYQKRFIKEVCESTPFESFAIGCSYSCNSLIGPNMWRHWDKPYIKAMADEIHKHGKLLHLHFHGKAMETIKDFVDIGVDCVCPFERGPGGDVNGLEGLIEVRKMLQDKVVMNGNVHTVETLIRGTEEDVRREVREVKKAFYGSARVIIGTGDQVGRETPEENIIAMIEEAKK